MTAFDLDASGRCAGADALDRPGQARALARVMASGAPLWLLDEPLNGLDATARRGSTRRSPRIARAGGAVLAASH